MAAAADRGLGRIIVDGRSVGGAPPPVGVRVNWLGPCAVDKKRLVLLTPDWLLGLRPPELFFLGGRPGFSSPKTSRRIDLRATSFAPTSAAFSPLLFVNCRVLVLKMTVIKTWSNES